MKKNTKKNITIEDQIVNGLSKIRHELFLGFLRRPSEVRYRRIRAAIDWFKDKYRTKDCMSTWGQIFAIESMLFDVYLNVKACGTRKTRHRKEYMLTYTVID